jgi:hypothetical protein
VVFKRAGGVRGEFFELLPDHGEINLTLTQALVLIRVAVIVVEVEMG